MPLVRNRIKRLLVFGFLSLLTQPVYAQVLNLSYPASKLKRQVSFTDDVGQEHQQLSYINRDVPGKPEVFKSGYLDVLSDGTMQGAARFLKLYIGDPEKFHLPFFIYTGVSAKTLGTTDPDGTKFNISNLLNQLGGLANFSFSADNYLRLNKSNDGPFGKKNITQLRLAYQFGARLVNGKDSVAKNNLNAVNTFANFGFQFQTGAWSGDSIQNMGVFFIQARAIASTSSRTKLVEMFGAGIESDVFYGYAVDAGIEINGVIDIKAGIYQYINNQKVVALKDPTVKFSANYSFLK